MIAQVEHTRKTGRSMALLRPETILTLSSPQIGDAPRRGRAMNFAGSHQAEQRPCGLRCRTRHSLVAPVIEPVACRVFAPAAIGMVEAAVAQQVARQWAGVEVPRLRTRLGPFVVAAVVEPPVSAELWARRASRQRFGYFRPADAAMLSNVPGSDG
jgi:hypothetical protein